VSAGWLPRRREREGGQCASCPFLDDNDKAFAGVVNALRRKNHLPDVDPDSEIVESARESMHLDVLFGSGDFVCHTTAYGPEMSVTPVQEHRQCPGATKLKKETEVRVVAIASGD